MLSLSMPRIRIIALALAALVIAPAIFYFASANEEPDKSGAPAAEQAGPPPAKVQIAVASATKLAPHVQLPGTVISSNDARLATEVSGKVAWVAEVGTELKANDVVLRLDDTLWRLQVTEDQATVRGLEANLKYLRNEVERLSSLLKTQHVPQSRFDEMVSRRDMTEGELTQARARLERARFQLSRAEMRTPFDGRVVERLIEMGEFANTGQEAVRVVDIGNLEISVQAPVNAAPYLAEGMDVMIDGRGVLEPCPIKAIVPVGDQVTRTFEIRVSVPEGRWIIGTAVKVHLPNGPEREAVSVPRDAIILRSDNVYVFRVGADNKAERIAVTTGIGRGDQITVSGDIKPGDKVITRGGEMIGPGQPVEILASS